MVTNSVQKTANIVFSRGTFKTIKHFVLVKIILIFAVFAQANVLQDDINLILVKNSGSYFSSNLPIGYSDKIIDSSRFPFDHPEVEKVFLDLEIQASNEWADYVSERWEEYQNSGYSEFEFTDEKSILEIKNNPYRYLGLDESEQLMPVENIYILYKKNEVIGYVIEVFNTIRSQIIEDGSGLVLYLDVDFKLVKITSWDA